MGERDCDGRRCYELRISPKRKNKYLLIGHIWVDAEDFGIVRIQGSPSKRVSFWTTHTEVERRYRRIAGIWLPERIESVSEILIAGRSTLSITYEYRELDTRTKVADDPF